MISSDQCTRRGNNALSRSPATTLTPHITATSALRSVARGVHCSAAQAVLYPPTKPPHMTLQPQQQPGVTPLAASAAIQQQLT